MKLRQIVFSTAVAASAVALLAGCSTGDATDTTAKATKSPKPEMSANPTSDPTRPPLEQASVACTDGSATVADMNNKEVTVADCASVTIASSNAVIKLGATKDLVVNGAINGIDAKSLEKVVINGDGNRVSTPSKPKVDDNGKKNRITR